MVKCYRVRWDGDTRGVAMPPEHRTGPSYMRGGVVACPKRRHASPWCALPPERCGRRHLEGGNGRVGLHGGDLAVGLARMLLQSVPMD